MKQVEERYISLLTDFGFKRIFGSAPNKDLLICFLNSLFNGRQVVKDVKYLNPENVGDIYTDRKAIFDVYCEGENGEKFIVEMQNAYQIRIWFQGSGFCLLHCQTLRALSCMPDLRLSLPVLLLPASELLVVPEQLRSSCR